MGCACHTKSAEAALAARTSSVRKARRALRVLGARRRRGDFHRGRKAFVTPSGSARFLPKAVRDDDWAFTTQVKEATTEPLTETLRPIFVEQRQAILRALERLQSSAVRTMTRIYQASQSLKVDPAPAIHRLVISNLIDWEDWAAQIVTGARPTLFTILSEGYETANDRIGVRGVDFTSADPRARQAADEILALVRDTEVTWQRRLAERIQRGLSEGDDFEDLFQRAQDLGEQQTGFRLRRTVRTAGNGVFEAGQLQAFREADFVTRRSWLTERDADVRGLPGDRWDHREADTQIQPVDQPFWIQRVSGIGGESIMHPNDPAGSPGNTVNCRCSQVAELDE
jgi:hypothetical protein